jgi:MFS family permease
MLFGATQTGATVLATDAGTPGVAGLVHATLGVGSALAGLATAYVPERVGHERRALVAAWALLALSLPLLVVGSLAGTAATVLFLGVAVAPYMIAVFSLAERVVPAARVGAAMTTLASATGLGYALGSSLAGRLADESGATAAFAVTVGATVLAVGLMSTQQQRLRTASAVDLAPRPTPGTAPAEPRVATPTGTSR